MIDFATIFRLIFQSMQSLKEILLLKSSANYSLSEKSNTMRKLALTQLKQSLILNSLLIDTIDK